MPIKSRLAAEPMRLKISDQIQHYCDLWGLAEDQIGVEAKQEILDYHRMEVGQALRDFQSTVIVASQNTRNENARNFLRYGVGRRIGALQYAYSRIGEIAAIGREEPASIDEKNEINSLINGFYINVIGALDNLAWFLVWQRGSNEVQALQGRAVGLFSNGFLGHSCFEGLRDRLVDKAEWFDTTRNRRDPIAHRIPFYVPTGFKPADAERFQQIENEIAVAFRSRDFDKIEKLSDEKDRLGYFRSYFLNGPNGQYYSIYPNIPEDAGYVLLCSGEVLEYCGYDIKR